jgi:hypothetical protein
MGKYLDIFRSVAGSVLEQPGQGYDINDINDKRSDRHEGGSTFDRLSRLCRGLEELEHRCPAYIDPADWQRTIEDGRRFVTKWGEQAEVLGWALADLFRLHSPPEKPAPSYRRLSRYDQTGLIWLLRGRPVVALTSMEAVILCQSGATLKYRRTVPAAAAPEIADAVEPIGKPTTEIGKASPAMQIDSAVALCRPAEAAINTMAQIGKPTPAAEITEVTSAAEIDVAAPARIIDAPKSARRRSDAETKTPRSKESRPRPSVDSARRRRVDDDDGPPESGKRIFLALAGVAAEKVPIALRNIAGEKFSRDDKEEMVAAINHLLRKWEGVKRKIQVKEAEETAELATS